MAGTIYVDSVSNAGDDLVIARRMAGSCWVTPAGRATNMGRRCPLFVHYRTGTGQHWDGLAPRGSTRPGGGQDLGPDRDGAGDHRRLGRRSASGFLIVDVCRMYAYV